MSEISKLRVYSLGIVAANKALSSKDIEATPIEDLPMMDGELTDAAADTTSRARDAEGGAYETRVSAAATVRATWLPLGCGNRLTAPDVRRGERVILYRFADQDKFWWVTQGQDLRLRKLETVIWGISAHRDENAVPGPDNMYWMEWSSHKGLIHIHTSKANAEPFAYDLQLNTKEGTFIFRDDDGQEFTLDSKERIWKVINRDGSYVEINKREITKFAPDRITLKTKDIVMQATNTISSSAGTSITETAPQVTMDGEVATTKDVAVAGTTTLKNGTLDLGTHSHNEQGDGAPVSPPF